MWKYKFEIKRNTKYWYKKGLYIEVIINQQIDDGCGTKSWYYEGLRHSYDGKPVIIWSHDDCEFWYWKGAT
jgi:uncharacterized protein (DUF2147 family)